MKPGRVPQPSSYCGYRKKAEIYGILQRRPPVNYGKRRIRLRQRNLGNGHGNLGERPQTAARGLDGSMAELLDVFADATRKLHPSTAANGLPRRFAMNSAAARSRSDRGNDIKGAESAV
jgi:hypothetical protein